MRLPIKDLLRNWNVLLFASLLALFGTSCYLPPYEPEYHVQNEAVVKSSLYMNEGIPKLTARYSPGVKFFFTQSKRPTTHLGIIMANGNGYACFDDLIQEAKIKAAWEGADFITLNERGVDTEYVHHFKIQRPWATFSLWIYGNIPGQEVSE